MQFVRAIGHDTMRYCQAVVCGKLYDTVCRARGQDCVTPDSPRICRRSSYKRLREAQCCSGKHGHAAQSDDSRHFGVLKLAGDPDREDISAVKMTADTHIRSTRNAAAGPHVSNFNRRSLESDGV